MKTLNYFLLTILSICLITACDVSQAGDKVQEENQSLENLALESSSWNKGEKTEVESSASKETRLSLHLKPTFSPVVLE